MMSAPDSLPLHRAPGLRAEGAPWPLTDYAPVLALTLLREVGGAIEILVGVRTPEANRYHQDVVSMPTRRLRDLDRAQSWLAPGGACASPAVFTTSASVVDEVHHILALKLGVAPHLDVNNLSLQVEGVGAWQGVSLIDRVDGREVTEDLTMFNAVVKVVGGFDLFPEETVSYRPLVWVPLESFRRAAATHAVDQLGIGDDLAAIQWCIRGLCIETAVAMLDRLAIT